MWDESELSEQARHHLADRVAFVVYGTITVLAAVGGLKLEAQTLQAVQAAAVLMVVALAAWMAHSMWRVIRARAGQDPEPERIRELHELLRSWPVVASGLPGATVMMLAAADAWSVSTGLRLAQALGVAALLVAGLLTARLANVSRSRQIVYVFALPLTGLAIVALEVVAHEV